MRPAALLLALLAGRAAAAPSSPARPPATVRISSAVVDWLRTYSLEPYRETWTTTLEVRDFDRDFPRAMTAVEKAGGRLVVPLQNSVGSPTQGTRQLIYDLDEKQARKALKALKKVGRLQDPAVHPMGEKLPVSEIERKIAALSRDKELHGAELAAMPAVSALVDAVLAHLVTARSVAQKLQGRVTLDLTVAAEGK